MAALFSFDIPPPPRLSEFSPPPWKYSSIELRSRVYAMNRDLSSYYVFTAIFFSHIQISISYCFFKNHSKVVQGEKFMYFSLKNQ